MPLYVRGQSERRRAPGDGARFVRREAPAFRGRRKTEMVKEIPGSARFLSALAIGFVVLTASSPRSGAQTFSRAFAVSPESSELEVVNQAGTIKVTAGANPTKIVITARQSGGAGERDGPQNTHGKGQVEVTGRGRVDFEIAVPASSSIDLLSYRGAIMVTNLAGAVRARVTDGDIQIAGLRSARVEARCTQGNVSFSGEVLPSGSYILKSFSGRIDAFLPADADFKLSAS